MSTNLSREFKHLQQQELSRHPVTTTLHPSCKKTTTKNKQLHWLPISERIKYKAASKCFHAVNGSGPAYLSELLPVYSPSRSLRSSSDSLMLILQQYKFNTRGFRTFSYFGPLVWNPLPQDPGH